MKEEQIIEGLKKSDRKALHQFNKRYRKLMIAIAFKVVKNIEDAEDIAQECFLKVLSGIDRYNGDCVFKGWLYKIVYNAAITHYHREKKHRQYVDLESFGPMQLPTRNFIDQLVARELWQKAMKRLYEISTNQYMYVRLYYVEGMTQDEISKDIEVPIGTVKSQVSRGAATMRGLIAELENVEPVKNIA